MNWYLQAFKKYAYFAGRSRRSEFWFYALYNILVLIGFKLAYAIAVGVGSSAMKHKSPEGIPPMQGVGAIALAVVICLAFALYVVGVIIPSLAVIIRRLHDSGRRSWWLLLAVVPVFGLIVLLIFMLLGSKPVENRYGPSPKVLPTA